MKLKKFFSFLTLVTLFATMVGCNMFDNKIPGENSQAVAGDMQNSDDLNIDDAGLGKWGEGASEASLEGAPNEWQPRNDVQFPTIYFAFDRDIIGATERAKLERVAQYLANQSQLGLIIEGHCDDRGTTEYNRALGERRANSVKNYLANMGLSPERVKTISYGDDKPAVSGDTPAARAKNRRAELIPADIR